MRGKNFLTVRRWLTLKFKNQNKLTKSPFLMLIKVGAHADSYWTGSHTINQAEVVFGVYRELFPQYNHIFLFNLSSEHCQKQVGGLNARAMKKHFGGKQPRIQDSMITQKDGFLRPFSPARKLTVGQIQNMNFPITCELRKKYWYAPHIFTKLNIPSPLSTTNNKDLFVLLAHY